MNLRTLLLSLTCLCAGEVFSLAGDDTTTTGSGSTTTSAPAPADDSGSASLATGNWGGLRDRLGREGLSFGFSWIGEEFRNFQGGIDTRDTVVASTADLNLTLDTEKALDWPGGKFYIDLEDHAGQDPSTVLTGDLQVFDKQNYSPYFQVFELYYEQKFLHDMLRVKVGKVDANTEFSVIDNGLDFIDSSTQVTPTLLAFPTTPDPLPSANIFFTPIDFFYASFGAYLANQNDRFLNFTGTPSAIQPTQYGILLIGEAGVIWKHDPLLQYDGNFKFGYWGHTGTFTRFDGSTQQGAEGFYAIFDQTLWKPTDKEDEARGLRMFLEYGQTDPAVSAIYQHTGGGIAWKGFLPQRPDDEIGFSPECAYLSSQAGLSHSHELILESFYKTQLTPWAKVQPELQYIVQPGGQYSNALVGIVQLSVQF
jgi:porin